MQDNKRECDELSGGVFDRSGSVVQETGVSRVVGERCNGNGFAGFERGDAVHDPGGLRFDFPSVFVPGTYDRPTSYVLHEYGRKFDIKFGSFRDCKFRLGFERATVVANALGRFPAADYTQVAHLSERVCAELLRDCTLGDAPEAYHTWDVLSTGDATQAKVCLQLATNPALPTSVSLRTNSLPCGLRGDRIVVLLPVFSEGDQRMELVFGSLMLFPPHNTKFSHFGVSVPRRYLPYLTIVSQHVEMPCFYVRTGNCGASQLAKFTDVPTVVCTGLDYRAEGYCVAAGAPRYSLLPLKSGVVSVRVHSAFEFVCGCFSFSAREPLTFAVVFPGVVANRQIMAYACFKPSGERIEADARSSARQLCLTSLGSGIGATCGTFAGFVAERICPRVHSQWAVECGCGTDGTR